MNSQLYKIVFTAFLLISSQAHAATSAPAASVRIEGATPFYVWQEEVPANSGTLLRQEPLGKELILDAASMGVRILYTSSGWDDRPVTVSGDVLIPKGAVPENGWPVLAWSHGTVGVADVCAPSYRGRSERDIRYLNKWVADRFSNKPGSNNCPTFSN